MTTVKSERTYHPAISFQPSIDNNWAPYHGENGNILSLEEWQEIIAKVNGFYSKATPEWIAGENERFQSEQCKMYETAIAMASSHKRPPTEKTSGWVYILQAGEYYKIGHSKTPAKRFEQLSTLPPWPTEIVHMVESENRHQLETELHERFAIKRANGEWFELAEEDVAWLKTL